MARSSRLGVLIGGVVRVLALPAALTASAGLATSVQAQAIDPGFTHQGELSDNGSPANGAYDLRFRVYDAVVGGVQQGPQLLQTLGVTNGRYTVRLDFTAAAFNGNKRWLEIDVRPTGAGPYTTLTPRQELTVAPHAWFSAVAGNSNTLAGQGQAFYTNAANMSSGTLPGARLSGAYAGVLTFSNVGNNYFGNGSNLTGLNASNIGSGTIGDARLSPNVALLNVAQSFTADKGFLANVGFGTTPSPFYPLYIQDTGGYTVHLTNDNAGAVFPTGGYYTIINGGGLQYGYVSEINGTGPGNGFNHYALNASPSGRGYYAAMTNTTGTGTSYGVYVSNANTTGYGGYFNNTATTGTTYGLYCENNSPSGYGLYARHDASTGTGVAIYGQTDSTSSLAHAIHGRVVSATPGGSSAALRGENSGTAGSGIGVWGSQAGTGWGGYFTTAGGRAVYAIASPATNTETSFGGYFSGGNSSASRGVYGTVSANGFGVYGNAGSGGRGVYGDAVDEGYGVYGSTDNGQGVGGFAVPTTATETCYGGYFSGGDSDNSRGVYGFVTGAGRGVYGYSTGGYGGYFDTGVSGGVALYVQGTASVGVLTIRGGADLAENFEVKTAPETILPGMVVMIDDEHEGAMELASGAYNRRVAGVVSGANELSAGMILGDFEGLENAKAVALTGRVWTFVDATDSAVEPGDLLTTSNTPGYAMPVVDHERASGATIGKAMSRLHKGEKGMVLVLVNLQ